MTDGPQLWLLKSNIRKLAAADGGEWPDPLGRSGRDATRGFIIGNRFHVTVQLCHSHHGCHAQFESAGRSLLSLRDPTGASHAAGPPDSTRLESIFFAPVRVCRLIPRL